jgi:hypothetical protein
MKTAYLPILVLSLCCNLANAGPAEHQEFDATLYTPFHAGTLAARTFTLTFAYPGLAQPANVHWRVELRAPGGQTVLRWRGKVTLTGDEITVTVPWSGRLGRQPAPDGIYRVRLRALVQRAEHDAIDQEWEIAVGTPRALATPAFAPLPGAFMPGALHRLAGQSAQPDQPQRRRRRRRQLPECPAAAVGAVWACRCLCLCP